MFPKKIVSWELVCDLIHAAKGSPNELKKYLTQIEKEDSRFECAKKYKCHDIVIDVSYSCINNNLSLMLKISTISFD